MELGARELMTIGTVLCGLAATWGMVKGQIGRLMDDLMKANKELEVIQARLDSSEAGEEVMKHQLGVLGSMLSPDHQEAKARETEALHHRVNALRRDCDTLMHTMENTHHFRE